MTELGTRGRLGLPCHVAQLRGLVAGQFPEEGKAWPGRIELQQIPLFHALLGARIIVLTSLDADQYFFQALKAGASGFLLKDVTETELTHSIRAVAAGHAVICPAMTRRLLDRFDIIPPNEGRWQAPTFGKLSGREAEVLAEIAHGRSNRQISLELHLATATVKTYVSSILTKLGRDNRTELALLAWQLGLVRPALRPGPGAAARSPHA